MILLKLGGSVITQKESEKPAMNFGNLQRLAQEISESSYEKLLIVHGAGSFGHPYAKKYGIGDEIKSDEDLRRKQLGFSVTQHAVKELNNVVTEYLRIRGILSISVQPSSFILTKNKRINSANLDLIKKYLDLGFVPVLHGDVVLDEDKSIGMAVLSGDQIVTYLAKKLQPDRVILGTDVDGIYNKNPKKHADAHLLEIVSSLDYLESAETDIVDVTGGMGGKLGELLTLADKGVESEIVNANRANIIKKAINGEKVTGTLIQRPIKEQKL